MSNNKISGLETANTSEKGFVCIEKQGNEFILRRDNKPYYIKGVGGSINLDIASRYGANSFRTWSARKAGEDLDNAHKYSMTVMLGIELSKKNEDYLEEGYKEKKRTEVRELLDKYKQHPALLIWALGNEINLGTNSKEAWEFINELAEIIKSQDNNHPVCTVTAGAPVEVLNNIAEYAPAIDLVGVNVYGGAIFDVRKHCEESVFKGPYAITEWGPCGHWEVPKTSWNIPIEQTSSEKAVTYMKGYEYINNNRDLFLGSYVFLWGQKEEITPTWYGVFLEDKTDLGVSGESCPTVDVLSYSWSGVWPENQAPKVTALKIDGLSAYDNVVLKAGQKYRAAVEAIDPDGDDITVIWETLKEATVLGFGGSYEPRPDRVGDVVKGTFKEITFTAPEAGKYRLYAYVLDGKGHGGTANVPYLVVE
jgi:hypothetical protein